MKASSTSPSNSDLPRQQQQLSSSIHSHSLAEGSMNMDDILRNIYTDNAHTIFPNESSSTVQNGGISNKMVDEIWKEIVTGGGRSRELPEMTLDDFSTKAGAATEDDVRITATQF